MVAKLKPVVPSMGGKANEFEHDSKLPISIPIRDAHSLTTSRTTFAGGFPDEVAATPRARLSALGGGERVPVKVIAGLSPLPVDCPYD